MELRETYPQAGISIREILPSCQIFGADNVRVRSCCHDWNQVQPGDLYVAKVGMEKDGHDHIRIAAKKGAAAILCERFVVSDVPVCLVDDTREAYGKICQRLAGDPKNKLKLVGVTGTDGKTIVSHVLRQIFRQSRMRTGSISSLGFCDGFVTSEQNDTTPHALDLSQKLRELVDNHCEAAVLEVSSVGIAERRISGLELDACVFTNIRRDHLDTHGTVENYRRIKTRLVERLKTGGFAVLNADDKFSNKWIQQLSCPALTYGMRNYAEVSAEVIERTPFEQTFLLTAGNETVPIRTPIIGDHFVRHCLASATVGLTMGLSLDPIVSGIESIDSIPGRMEKVNCVDGVSVYVDAARTPHQLSAMLKTLSRAGTGGRVRCVFGAADRLSSVQRAGLGTVAERFADDSIISGVDSHNESVLELAHDILDGYDDVAQAHLVPNRAAAIRHMLDTSQPGDMILMAGLGEKPTRFGYQEEIQLTDRQLCEAWAADATSLDSLCMPFDDQQPAIYPIDNYR